MMRDLVERAVEVCRNVPHWGEIHFSNSDCLMAVGVENESTYSESNTRQFHRVMKGLDQIHGPPFHPNTEEDNTKRAVYLASLIVVNPGTGKKAALAYIMRVAGFTDHLCGPGKDYVRVSRRVTAAKKKKPPPPPPAPPAIAPQNVPKAPQHRPPAAHPYRAKAPVKEVQVHDDDSVAPSMILSPMSASSFSTASREPARKKSTVDDEDLVDFFNTPPYFAYAETMPPSFSSAASDASSQSVNLSYKDAKHRPKSINSNISHLTTSKTHRRTTQAAQIERQQGREFENLRKSMYKAGTVIYKLGVSRSRSKRPS
ncbi:hypothetical protein SEMRO_590_G171930.1 [Seminavis robusta]|uniref:Uncharacterized protein n=1 Tax=Seminavis robusta TaxID=568900 RepID=A0A9N8E7C4_9STRA|nr:hypothetical protein SEMRO_590_G171930.1 [Seminavis robusta]|eukprot:Sro590_g171930.1 n/a (314) ;mRNA; f:47981-49020